MDHLPFEAECARSAGFRIAAWISGGYLSKYSVNASASSDRARAACAICVADGAWSSPPTTPVSRDTPPADRGGQQRHVIVDRAGVGEERLQPVVVLLQDRIELVIVAAGAAERQAEEDGAGGVGDVVQDLLAALPQVPRVATRRDSGG